MKHETLWFRLAVAALAVVGIGVLILSLHGLHRPSGEDATLSSVPAPAPETPIR